MAHRLYHGDCLKVMRDLSPVKCIFADPPDGIGLDYDEFDDKPSTREYESSLWCWLDAFTAKAEIVWFSFNARWTAAFGSHVHYWLSRNTDWQFKPCVQVFTFGQHSHTDLGNNHRPLWRLMRKDAKLYPDQIRVPSWRQENGDKRADPRGRVPGDVFDFTRVTGNSHQRRTWHPTQLNEGLVERCILMSTKEGESVLDPFAGTGTTLRVCKRLNRPCTLIEYDKGYCKQIAAENGLKRRKEFWSC